MCLCRSSSEAFVQDFSDLSAKCNKRTLFNLSLFNLSNLWSHYQHRSRHPDTQDRSAFLFQSFVSWAFISFVSKLVLQLLQCVTIHFVIRFTDLNKDTICESLLSPPLEGYRSIFSYNLSKMCNMLFALELHRRWSSTKVNAFAVHPGNVVPTAISRNWWLWRILFTLARPFAKSKVCTSVFRAN